MEENKILPITEDNLIKILLLTVFLFLFISFVWAHTLDYSEYHNFGNRCKEMQRIWGVQSVRRSRNRKLGPIIDLMHEN